MEFFQKILTWIKQQSKWKKIGGIVILLAVTSVFVIPRVFTQQGGYIFDTVKKTTVKEVVTDSGTITSDGKVEVYSPTNGIITKVFVQNGQAVKEDDNLFSVKSSATAQEQQTAYAAYQAAIAAENTAETLLHTYRSAMFSSWKTYRDLATNSTYESSSGVPNEDNRKNAEFITTQDNWLAAEKQFKDQEQAVAAAAAQVVAAWSTYLATQTTTATASIDGIVTNLSVSEGKSVEAPSLLHPTATPVLTIVNSNHVEAVLQIGQTDIAKVKVGQLVKIHPDPYKDSEYDGKVIRIDSLGQNTQGVVTYNVYIAFTSADEILRPGMTVDGDIITNMQENVTAVPNSAVVVKDGKKTVRVLENNQMVYVPVTTGIKGETYTQITHGVQNGQKIISGLTNQRAASTSFLGL